MTPPHCAIVIPVITTNYPPHRLNKSRGQRVVWLLEELGLEYDIAVYKRDENKRAGPDLKAVHPLGKSPAITIRPANSDKDIVIVESATIMEYICDHFGKQLMPARYPEGQEGVLGAETEEWMRYKVRHALVTFGVRRKIYMFKEISAKASQSACVARTSSDRNQPWRD